MLTYRLSISGLSQLPPPTHDEVENPARQRTPWHPRLQTLWYAMEQRCQRGQKYALDCILYLGGPRPTTMLPESTNITVVNTGSCLQDLDILHHQCGKILILFLIFTGDYVLTAHSICFHVRTHFYA